mgnify:FL=1
MVIEKKVTLGIPLSATDAIRFQQSAGARRMTQAAYLVALMDLHDAVRDVADHAFEPESLARQRMMRDILEQLGLETVVR